jgi:hypothetical protein
MRPVSRTPEGWPNRCPECGRQLSFQASHTIESDVLCPGCYSRISFVRLKGLVRSYVTTSPSPKECVEIERRELAKIFPEEVARENHICPMVATDDCVFVAASDPDNEELRDKLRFILNREVHLCQAEDKMIDWMIEQQYRKTEH